MSEKLNIEELEALVAASTPGPWRATHRHVGCSEFDDEQGGLGLEIEGPAEPQLRGQFARSADARLIAAAPDLAKRLIAVLKSNQDEVLGILKFNER